MPLEKFKELPGTDFQATQRDPIAALLMDGFISSEDE
jgi:hypothetical protein